MIKLLNIMFVTALLALGSIGSSAEEGVLKVSKSVIVDTTPDMLWQLLGEFNGLDKWHPAVIKSTLEGNGVNKGDIRVLTLSDGALIHDELLEHDNKTMSYTYKLGKSPLPVDGYVGTLKIEKNEKGTSTVTWFSSFNAVGISDKEATDLIGGIYQSGLDALTDLY